MGFLGTGITTIASIGSSGYKVSTAQLAKPLHPNIRGHKGK